MNLLISKNCVKKHLKEFLIIVFACCFVCLSAWAETPVNVALEDIDSGLTSPQGHYRWMDVADQLYSEIYRDSYNYTQATVQINFFTGGLTLHGVLTANNLKPHFAYQLKLVGMPERASNESIGLTGRWWQEEWNGSEWTNGRNLNNKGDGSSPSPNDEAYFTRREISDPASPSGRRYRFTGYLVFDYFITDANGNASLSFEVSSSYHVLWKTSRDHTAQDGPVRETTFTGGDPDSVSAYNGTYPETTVSVFGEWERLPMGGVMLPPGNFEGQFILTEESFHGSGSAGGWASAMGATANFFILNPNIPTVTNLGIATMTLLLIVLGSYILLRRFPI
jgi:hypothetical protein